MLARSSRHGDSRRSKALARGHSPWIRAGLAALVMATLPFAWSEDVSCDHKPQPLVSGADIVFGDVWLGAVFLAAFLLPVALGVAAARTWRPWWRLVAQVVAGVATMGATLLCLGMMTYGRPEQPLVHPAAWIGTLTAFAMLIETWASAGRALRSGIVHRRAAKALADAPAAARARIADPPEEEEKEPATSPDEEADAVADAQEPARRSRRSS